MKAIVSVIGKDKKGIIAKVSAKLYDMDINVEDYPKLYFKTTSQ